MKRDIAAMGRAMTDTHRAWAEMLPLTTSPPIDAELASYAGRSFGQITSGCGGGYVMLATEEDIPNSFRVRIRR